MKRSTLSGKQQFALYSEVQANYAASCLTDEAFAAQACEKLGFQVTRNNVAGAREAFGIPSTRDARITLANVSLEARITALEHEVQSLLDAFAVFKHGCRGDKK